MLDVVFKGFISSSNHMLIAHKPLQGSLSRADQLEASPVTGLITLEDVLETVIQVGLCSWVCSRSSSCRMLSGCRLIKPSKYNMHSTKIEIIPLHVSREPMQCLSR